MKPVFSYDNYKAYLRDNIAANSERHGYQSILSKAIGCHKTFLSQCLNSRVELTLDHAFRLTKYWNFSEAETDYYIHLVLLARASSLELSNFCKAKLAKLKSDAAVVKTRYEGAASITEEQVTTYYSNWVHCAVHVLASIPGQSADAIAQRLKLDLDVVKKSISVLRSLGIVEVRSNLIHVLRRDIFLDKLAPMSPLFHMLWQQRAAQEFLTTRNPDSIHFTNAYALSKKDLETVRQLIHDVIGSIRKVVAPSKEEDAVCLNIDFFRI